MDLETEGSRGLSLVHTGESSYQTLGGQIASEALENRFERLGS